MSSIWEGVTPCKGGKQKWTPLGGGSRYQTLEKVTLNSGEKGLCSVPSDIESIFISIFLSILFNCRDLVRLDSISAARTTTPTSGERAPTIGGTTPTLGINGKGG